MTPAEIVARRPAAEDAQAEIRAHQRPGPGRAADGAAPAGLARWLRGGHLRRAARRPACWMTGPRPGRSAATARRSPGRPAPAHGRGTRRDPNGGRSRRRGPAARGRRPAEERTSVDEGKRVSVRIDVGGRRIIKKKKKNTKT